MYEYTSFVPQRQLPSFPPNASLTFEPQYADLAPWDFAAQYAPAPVQSVPQRGGISFGTFLAFGTTAVSAVILFNPKASKEAKAVAQIALGTSVPFLLTKLFDWQAWPEPQWN